MLKLRGKEYIKHIVTGVLIVFVIVMALWGAAWAATSVFQRDGIRTMKNSQKLSKTNAVEVSFAGYYELDI